ncbi:oligopeptide-binding protein OppA [Brevibacillus reuszeri]|uniref:peptide ABC transporter substrate-binding protein n=1 Tax=Brevibacillus reuszeri TaxID=54915 RepID=UPI001B0565D6|nr:peptide ABC transporter substrate-binding protein [Brevibacillus reuszeri]GIO09316.1 oligopeptide-binding protein OppA [Brevibacillus reuszeri]
MKKNVFILMSSILILGGIAAGSFGPIKAIEPKVLRLNFTSDPPTVDPGIAEDSASGTVIRAIFEGLTRLGKDGKIHAAAAESYTVSTDGKIYTFKIRESKWSNGDPVTAHDFEYAWKRALEPKTASNYAYQLYYLKGAEAFNKGTGKAEDVGVKAIDSKTLVVELKNPTPFFTELTAFHTYFPMNKKAVEASVNWAFDAKTIVGNGPFRMDSWVHKSRLVLVKNVNYWDRGNVNIDKISFSIVDDENIMLNMFNNGELDWAGAPTSDIPLDAGPALLASGKLITKPIAGTYFYRFNTDKAPFNNSKIRKAFAYAIDRQMIMAKIPVGHLPATGFVPPSMDLNQDGYFKDNDIEGAKKLLQDGMKEVGITKLPPITLSYNTSSGHSKIAEEIVAQWKSKLGVDVVLEDKQWKVHLEDVHQGKYQVARAGWLGDFNDPINFLEMFKDKDGGNNDTRWENSKYKELLNQSALEPDLEKRKAILAEAEQILMDEMPIMPIYYYAQSWVQSDKVNGVIIDGLGMADYKYADIKQ